MKSIKDFSNRRKSRRKTYTFEQYAKKFTKMAYRLKYKVGNDTELEPEQQWQLVRRLFLRYLVLPAVIFILMIIQFIVFLFLHLFIDGLLIAYAVMDVILIYLRLTCYEREFLFDTSETMLPSKSDTKRTMAQLCRMLDEKGLAYEKDPKVQYRMKSTLP